MPLAYTTYLSSVVQVIGASLVFAAICILAGSDDVDDVAVPAALLGLGVTAFLGSSAAVAALSAL